MTRLEFDAWIEAHYGELLAVAKKRTDCESDVVLQDAVMGMLASPDLPKIGEPGRMGAWPWAVSWVRGKVSDDRKLARRRGRLKEEARSVSSLGEGGNKRTYDPSVRPE